jgi:hypothetical protein
VRQGTSPQPLSRPSQVEPMVPREAKPYAIPSAARIKKKRITAQGAGPGRTERGAIPDAATVDSHKRKAPPVEGGAEAIES